MHAFVRLADSRAILLMMMLICLLFIQIQITDYCRRLYVYDCKEVFEITFFEFVAANMQVAVIQLREEHSARLSGIGL